MHPLAVFLATTSAFTHAWRELQTKKSNDKQIFIWWFGLAALILYFPLFAYYIVQEGITAEGLLIVSLSGLVHCFYWYFLSKAYEDGDLSHVYPIMRSSPAIVLLLAVLILKEDVTMLGVIGIFTILAGVYCINLKKVSLQGFLEPLSSLRERSTQFALLTAITVAMYSIVDKLGVAQMHPVIFVYLITVFVMIFNTIYVFALKKRHLVWDEWKSHPGMIVCNGFLTMFSYLLILIALTFERASYVTSLRQLSIVFGVMFGGHLLREKHKVLRLSASSLILAGVLCISLSS